MNQSELHSYYKTIFQDEHGKSLSDELIDDLCVYDEANENAKKSQEQENILPNTGKFHSSIMMSKMIDTAQQDIFMVLGQFDSAVSDNKNYIQSLQNAIQRLVKFHIIFLDNISTHRLSKAYHILLEYKNKNPDNVHFFLANEKAKEILTNSLPMHREYHYATFDNQAFRTELLPKAYAALGAYVDEGRVSALKDIFAEMKLESVAGN